jgi:hypothetical protein
MYQAATYWPPGSNDGFGGVQYGPPEPRLCRWQDKAVLFRDAQGREATSESIVYVATPVAIGGRLMLGESLELLPPEEAIEVRQIDVSPDLGNTEELHKAYL